MSKDRKDRIVAVIMMIFAVFIFVGAVSIPKASMGEGPGPEAFPIFLAVVLAVLSIMLFWTAGRKKKKEEPKEAKQAMDEVQAIDEPAAAKIRRVITSVILLMVYFIILPFLGFIASTVIYGIAFLMLLYSEKAKATLIPAIAITIFAFVIFEMALSIPLPAFMEAIK